MRPSDDDHRRDPQTDSSTSDPHVLTELPDFFVLGAAKCGTTSLHHYLQQHPDLYLPSVKELDFFDADEERFYADLDWYLDYFRGTEAPRTGEATPLYFRRTDTVPQRMHQVYGNSPPLFIVLLRDPVQRAYSHYLHKVSQGTEPLSFEEALRAEDAHPDEKQYEWKSYFTDGCYADRLEHWFDHFSRDRFLILLTRDLAQTPDVIVRKTFHFLSVTRDVPVDTSVRLNQTGEQQSYRLGRLLSHLPSWLPSTARGWTPEALRLRIEQLVRRRVTGSGSDQPALDPVLEQTLRERYESHVRKLADIIDEDLSAWLPDSEA